MPRKKKYQENEQIAEGQSKVCGKDAWCWVMDNRLAPEANDYTRQGFAVMVTTRMEPPFPTTVQGIVYRHEANTGGILIHFCPFCGTDLYELYGHHEKGCCDKTEQCDEVSISADEAVVL